MKRFLAIPLLLVYVAAFSQQSIFATIAGGDLYSFNLTNCSRKLVGSTGYGFGDIAFTTDGRLWGIVGGDLYQIDTTTAHTTLIGNTGLGAVSLVGLNDSTLLVEYSGGLYGINTRDASNFFIDNIGFQANGDLTWYDDDLYVVTSAGQIIKIVLSNDYSAILNVTAIGSSVPTCEGAVTASFAGDYNSIVGFNGPNLIKICQLDGSSVMLCPGLNDNGTPGAASVRLPTQSPIPPTCYKVNAVSAQPTMQATFEISPNPTTTSEITILADMEQKVTFNIFNTIGQLLQTGVLAPGETTIRLHKLPKGLYNLGLSVSNKTVWKNFIVD